MHDPDTQAFELKVPSRKSEFGTTVLRIWHHDPCKDGSDDSCGWFMRARHGDKEVLRRIEKAFEFDWDRVFKSDSGKMYYVGLFEPSGLPVHSSIGITLNLFRLACWEHFKHSHKKTKRFMSKNLYGILHFAENTTDSLHDSITSRFGGEKRDERIKHFASCIYGYILREERHWWQHPKFHLHHWRIQVPLFQQVKRAFFDRCYKCKKGFKRGESVMSNWDGDTIWHDDCENRNRNQTGASVENSATAI